MGFAINPPSVPFVFDDGRLTPEGYRFLAQVHRILGEDAVASLLAAPFLTYAADASLTAEKVLTAGAGISFSSGASTFTVAIGTNAVSNALFRQSAALSVVGRSANSTGNVADIAAASDHQVLRRSGTAIGFGAVDLTQSAAVTGALTVPNGGTGIASYTTGDILYASGASALSALAGVATGNALISGGVSTAPSWGKIGLTTHVSGVLDASNGGTGVSNSSTITLGGNLTTSGAFTLTLTVTANTNVTLPTTGTLATLAGAESLSNKTFSNPPIFPEYTVAGVPSAATYDNGVIIVSNEAGGRTLATSDGTNWRRVSDGAVIS
jgi:hypothetical protein